MMRDFKRRWSAKAAIAAAMYRTKRKLGYSRRSAVRIALSAV